MAAGAAVYFGFDFTLASGSGDLSPAAAQALNLLALKLYLPVGAGGVIFGVGAGITIIRGSLLPTWVGWADNGGDGGIVIVCVSEVLEVCAC